MQLNETRAWNRFYAAGTPVDIEPVTSSLVDLLEQRVAQYGERDAIAFFGRTVTYDELGARVARVAEGLRKLGVGAGDRVALIMPNAPQHVIAFYAVLQGVFLGALSQAINAIPQYEGVVLMAVLATLCTFVAMYVGYATGFVKVNARTRRMFFFAIVGYAIFSLLQVVLLWTGVLSGWGFGGSGGLGIILSLLGVGLAAYSLAIDFDSIDHAVRVGAPQRYSWLLAHGLVVSVVWLYVEFLRLFARLRD